MELQKLMIVDDEKIILRGLIETYNWEDMGFEVIASAQNGEEALQKMIACKPDVVLTDICMKKMDGLKLMEESKKVMPEVKFVVLSAYKDFSYAQKACEYGAFTYLVKPIEEKELYQTFSNIATQCRQEKANKKEQNKWKKFMDVDKQNYTQFMLERFLQNMISCEELRQSVEGLENGISEEHFYCALKIDLDILYKIEEQNDFCMKKKELFSALEKRLKEEYQIWYIDQVDESRIYLIDNKQSKKNLGIKYILQQIQEELDVEWICAVSGNYQGIQGIQQAYIESNKLYDMEYEEGSGIFINVANSELSDMGQYSKDVENDILAALRKNEEAQMKESFIRFIYSLPDDEATDKVYLHQLAVRTELLLGITYGLTPVVQKGYQDFYQALEKCTDVKLADILYKLFKLVIKERKDVVPENANKHFDHYVEKACDYIRQHLSDEELSIATVAEHVFLNQVYFGRLFKQVMNMSFKRYLLKTRLEYARQLMEESDYSINDICVRVGISNPSYFSKLFKQEIGMQPSEYKRNQI